MNLTVDYAKIEKMVTKYLKSYTVKDIVKLMSKRKNIKKDYL